MMRRVTETNPLTVPPGKVFVITGVCREKTSPSEYRIDAIFDGETVLKTSFSYNLDGANGMICDVPPGLVAPSGTLVEVLGSKDAGGVLLGYLASN